MKQRCHCWQQQCSNLYLYSPDHSTWPMAVSRQYVYQVKFNKRRSQSWL